MATRKPTVLLACLKTEFMSSLVPLTHNSIPVDYKNTFVCKALPKALLRLVQVTDALNVYTEFRTPAVAPL